MTFPSIELKYAVCNQNAIIRFKGKRTHLKGFLEAFQPSWTEILSFDDAMWHHRNESETWALHFLRNRNMLKLLG